MPLDEVPLDEVEKLDDLFVTELISVGLVRAGANPESDILITKAVEDDDDLFLRATAPHSTATSNKPWDGGAARRALPNQAAALRRAHAWVDPSGDPDAKSSYKFPHHSGGAANLAGVRNALARLPGSKIPAGDKAGVRAHLARHLRDGGGNPAPPKKKTLTRRFREKFFGDRMAELEKIAVEREPEVVDVEKKRNIAEMLEARIHANFTEHADSLFGDGRITRDERKAASSAIGAALDAFTAKLRKESSELFERDPFLDERPEPAEKSALEAALDEFAPTAESETAPTLDPERKRKEAHVPDIKLSDEAREALDETSLAYVEHIESALVKAAEKLEEQAEGDGGDPAAKVYEGLPDEVVAVLKERDAERDKAVEEALAKATAAETKATALEAVAKAKEFVEKASEFGHIGKAEDLGPVLQEISDGVSEDTAAKLDGYLKAANGIIDDGEFFREFGLTGGDPVEGSALAMISKKATELRLADKTLSQEQAEARVMAADPELAKRADDEERERVAKRRS